MSSVLNRIRRRVSKAVDSASTALEAEAGPAKRLPSPALLDPPPKEFSVEYSKLEALLKAQAHKTATEARTASALLGLERNRLLLLNQLALIDRQVETQLHAVMRTVGLDPELPYTFDMPKSPGEPGTFRLRAGEE